MKILVLGAGMYVTGRNSSANGTVLSALVQVSKEVKVNKIVVVATKNSNAKLVEEGSLRKLKMICNLMSV